MTRIANRAFEMSSKSTGLGAIEVPDIPRFKRCAYAKSGGTGGIILDSRHDPLPPRAAFDTGMTLPVDGGFLASAGV